MSLQKSPYNGADLTRFPYKTDWWEVTWEGPVCYELTKPDGSTIMVGRSGYLAMVGRILKAQMEPGYLLKPFQVSEGVE